MACAWGRDSNPRVTCHSHEITAISKPQRSNQFPMDIKSCPTFFLFKKPFNLDTSQNMQDCFMHFNKFLQSKFFLQCLHVIITSALRVCVGIESSGLGAVGFLPSVRQHHVMHPEPTVTHTEKYAARACALIFTTEGLLSGSLQTAGKQDRAAVNISRLSPSASVSLPFYCWWSSCTHTHTHTLIWLDEIIWGSLFVLGNVRWASQCESARELPQTSEMHVMLRF